MSSYQNTGCEMNERIEELALQATVAVTKPDGHYIVQAWQAKFAELIVQEAMTVTKTYTSNQGLDYSAPVALARHFGVGQ
jgi:hypothetical protein